MSSINFNPQPYTKIKFLLLRMPRNHVCRYIFKSNQTFILLAVGFIQDRKCQDNVKWAYWIKRPSYVVSSLLHLVSVSKRGPWQSPRGKANRSILVFLFAIWPLCKEHQTACCRINMLLRCQLGQVSITNASVLVLEYGLVNTSHSIKADSRFASSQWEAALLCNDVSHWLGAYLESALCILYRWLSTHLISQVKVVTIYDFTPIWQFWTTKSRFW